MFNNEVITPEYELRWIEDGKILLVVMNSIAKRDVAERFYDTLDEYVRNWPDGKPYLILFDSRNATSDSWTTYMRQRSEQAHALIPPHAQGRTASVSVPSMTLRFIKGFVELGLNRKNRRVQTRIVYTYEEALDWLLGFKPL